MRTFFSWLYFPGTWSLSPFLSTTTIASIIHSWIAQTSRLLCTNTGGKYSRQLFFNIANWSYIFCISSVFPLCLNCTNLNVYIQILLYIYESWCIYIRNLMYIYESCCIYTKLDVYIQILMYVYESCCKLYESWCI